ncbi:MAG: DUF763 domain-containing protein [Acidobacteriota bacterium]|nr:DUF763 domain-containing protein [Acidobacteriota bacterium]
MAGAFRCGSRIADGQLGAAIVETVVHRCGQAEFPFAHQGPVLVSDLLRAMGMGWHSSGMTTSVQGGRQGRDEACAAYLQSPVAAALSNVGRRKRLPH